MKRKYSHAFLLLPAFLPPVLLNKYLIQPKILIKNEWKGARAEWVVLIMHNWIFMQKLPPTISEMESEGVVLFVIKKRNSIYVISQHSNKTKHTTPFSGPPWVTQYFPFTVCLFNIAIPLDAGREMGNSFRASFYSSSAAFPSVRLNLTVVRLSLCKCARYPKHIMSLSMCLSFLLLLVFLFRFFFEEKSLRVDLKRIFTNLWRKIYREFELNGDGLMQQCRLA